MDRKFGAPWNVIIGEYFSFEITFEARGARCLAAPLLPPPCGSRPRVGAQSLRPRTALRSKTCSTSSWAAPRASCSGSRSEGCTLARMRQPASGGKPPGSSASKPGRRARGRPGAAPTAASDGRVVPRAAARLAVLPPPPPQQQHLTFDFSRLGQARLLLGPTAIHGVVQVLRALALLLTMAQVSTFVYSSAQAKSVCAVIAMAAVASLLPLSANAGGIANLVATLLGFPPIHGPRHTDRRLHVTPRRFDAPEDAQRCAAVLSCGAFASAGAAPAWLIAAGTARELPPDSLAVVLSQRPRTEAEQPALRTRRQQAHAAWGEPASARQAAPPPFEQLLGVAVCCVARDVPVAPLLGPRMTCPPMLGETMDVAILRSPLLGGCGWFAADRLGSARSARLAADALSHAAAASGAAAGAVVSPPPLLAAELLRRGAHTLPSELHASERWVVAIPEQLRGCGSLAAFCTQRLSPSAAADVARKQRRFAALGGTVTALPRGCTEVDPALLALLSASLGRASTQAPGSAAAAAQPAADGAPPAKERVAGADPSLLWAKPGSTLSEALAPPPAMPPPATLGALLGVEGEQLALLGAPTTASATATLEAGSPQPRAWSGDQEGASAGDGQRPLWVIVARIRGAPVAALLLVADPHTRRLSTHSAAFGATPAGRQRCSPFFALLHGAIELGLVHGAVEVDLGPGAAGGAKARLGAVPTGGDAYLLFQDWRLGAHGSPKSVGATMIRRDRIVAAVERAAAAAAAKAARATSGSPGSKRMASSEAAARRSAQKLARVVRGARPERPPASAGSPAAQSEAGTTAQATAKRHSKPPRSVSWNSLLGEGPGTERQHERGSTAGSGLEIPHEVATEEESEGEDGGKS